MTCENPSMAAAASSSLVPEAQTILSFFDQLKALSPSVGYEMIMNICEDNRKLQGRLDDMSNKVKKREATIDGMLEVNEKAKSQHRETIVQVQKLEKVIQEKESLVEKQIRGLCDRDTQIKKLTAEIKKQADHLARTKQECGTLQGTIEAKDTIITGLKTDKVNLTDRLTRLEKLNSDIEEANQTLKSTLGEIQTKLCRVEGFTVGHIDSEENILIDSFTGLWELAKTKLNSAFAVDLPPESFQNVSAWTKLKESHLAQTHRIPLPCSNSQAAKQVRSALVLAILAREIDQHVFQPVYTLPTDPHIRQTLIYLARTDFEKESFCRSLLQSINPDMQDKSLQTIIKNVVSNVLCYIDDILPDTQRASLYSEIEVIVRKAAEVWQLIRRSKRMYEPDFDPLESDEDWIAFDAPDKERSASGSKHNPREPDTLTVFPRLSSIENNNVIDYSVVIQLASSSHFLSKARSEIKREPSSSSVVRKMAQTWRNRSVTSKDTNVRQSLEFANGHNKVNGK
ncbi:hypothetical protein BO86DRAFT_393251 [Aspergillus japonicus CBS 114.51]|uniref:Uncharacterized protein n=1 Tax=Aspergillus japonicus CBS 114.51 TaxID=1448312 RepID=A0A8T8WLV5_ASPJA|nr:hypothetical protein BO86DRAFT_393251 [Aspergillus japonicus CBS 114.51]RAH76684.1 hypothetical protein BO86DRAFT_393251 [Aspergillus japonicus CBS 114.51]